MSDTDGALAPHAHPHMDAQLVADLLRGDEATFMRLVELYQPAMVRLAQSYVGDRSIAEDVAQEAWVSALRNLAQFQGRSSFKTWLFHILVNAAKTRGQRERRSVPFSALSDAEEEDGADAASVDPSRFQPVDGHATGSWVTFPQRWDELPEAEVDSRETHERLLAAIERLPASQRRVIRLRDVEGYSSEDVRQILGLSEGNERVLLHRARSRVRQALEAYFAEE